MVARAPEILVPTAPDMTVVMVMAAAEARAKVHHRSACRGGCLFSDVSRLCWHRKGSDESENKHSPCPGGSAMGFRSGVHWSY